MNNLRILAIDQGSKSCGLAYLEDDVVHWTTVIRPRAALPWAERMDNIAAQIAVFSKARMYEPDVIAVESVVVWRNVRTALVMGETRGYLFRVIRELFPLARLVNVSPSETKAAVGAGRSRDAAKRRTRLVVEAMTHRPDLSEDEADAVAIGLAVIEILRREQLERAEEVGFS